MSETNSAHYWNEKYENNHFPWDLGRPTPVFMRLVEDSWLTPGKMLVPGAGRGYDARLFARHGFEVTAVDFAPEAIAAMEELASPSAPINIIQADFFELPQTWNGRFDYVLDADLVARLLKPGGTYVVLAFPIGTRPGGPPYVVQPDEMITLFAARGFSLQHREMPPDSVPQRRRIEELLLLEK